MATVRRIVGIVATIFIAIFFLSLLFRGSCSSNQQVASPQPVAPAQAVQQPAVPPQAPPAGTPPPATPQAPAAQPSPSVPAIPDLATVIQQLGQTKVQVQQTEEQKKQSALKNAQRAKIEAEDELKDVQRQVNEWTVRVSCAKLEHEGATYDAAGKIIHRQQIADAELWLQGLEKRLTEVKAKLQRAEALATSLSLAEQPKSTP